jgi:hypothetical protein
MSGEQTSDRRAQLLDAYRQERLASQAVWFARRAQSNETARRRAVTASAALLVLAALFGALASADASRRSLWGFAAAVAGALATALSSYAAAFGFERLARLYSRTSTAVAVADVFGPRPDELARLDSDTERDHVVAQFVADTERLLRGEVDTWSRQAALQPDEAVVPTTSESGPLQPS